ncbi:MAG: c-type cytochrome [Candidatus Eisenbacteria bacterium]|uniref:C-type cytochrome n=1 Tax=Eiseniibacteriota bacterium TaxID=2212470 RepID=A0A956SE60_UNCEI|nr:c-type cytochrome [Candidatus Eisenbacteria bacterium]
MKGGQRRARVLRTASVVGLVILAGCSDETSTSTPEPVDDTAYYSGGETTIFNATSQAFTFPAPNVAQVDRHFDGDLAFDVAFIAAGGTVHSGLGPVFNDNACVACHISNGRGRSESGGVVGSLLLRASVPGTDPHGGPMPAPGFGGQLNDQAVFGTVPEVRVRVTYDVVTRSFEDGTTYELHPPRYELVDTYVPLPAGMLLSPRIGLPVFGRGLLEAVPEETILALADENDADEDGISGRPNWVWDVLAEGVALGRFGWKANQPSLVQQAAAAYRNDMGITNPLFPTESTTEQEQHDGLADDPEISLETVELSAFYTQTLAVPARRNIHDETVRRGERLFEEAKCVWCHVARLETGPEAVDASLENQVIHPYSDLLLHDMGEELADGRPDFVATGSEWRTPPLWGLGLVRTVQGEVNLLHDGRAKSILEAVMWHGGEAEDSREAVRRMSREEREALVAFLESL